MLHIGELRIVVKYMVSLLEKKRSRINHVTSYFDRDNIKLIIRTFALTARKQIHSENDVQRRNRITNQSN